MTLRAVGNAFLRVAVLLTAACGGDLGGAATQPGTTQTHQDVQNAGKVLILGSSVNGGLNSREALAVRAARKDVQVEVATPEQWKAMTATQFMQYRALIIGDAACQSGEAAFQAAVQTRNRWGAIVDGRVSLLATDPSTNNTPRLVENAIKFVVGSASNRTGMYIALGCAYQNAQAAESVTLLEPFGAFQVQAVPGCASAGHVLQMKNENLVASVTDSMLGGNGCVARSVFTQYPERDFSFAALALTSPERPVPGARVHVDFIVNKPAETPYTGTPYVLVRGAMAFSAGCGTSAYTPSGEECDFGDSLNGRPAVPGQNPLATCSYACRQHWCGDGFVDADLGEECDEGINNGREIGGTSGVGTCTASCRTPRLSDYPSAHPPTAVCGDRMVVAEYTCSADYVGIDNGSYDVDNDLVGCTQSTTGPFDIGSTTVKLTCTDQTGLTSECTGVVTVVDQAIPTITLNGTVETSEECVAGATYVDPGATVTDLCEGTLPYTVTGTVDLGKPGSYSLTYNATDASGHHATPVVRNVDVADTLPPQLQVLPGPSTIACNAPYVDPGATASDLCEADLTAKIAVTSNVDSSKAGQYTVTYSVADKAGHVSTAVRNLTVQGPCSSGCVNLHLGDYNLFLLGDYNGGHDVVGKVAAGGNITLTDFRVGVELPDNDISNTLVAGGNLTLTRGAVWGHAFYGGTYSSDPSVVYPRGGVAQGTPIDFAARFAELRALSTQLAGLPVNGTTVRTSWGGVMLSGNDSGVNVFDVNASAFNGAKLLSIRAPAGSLAVVNIRGASASFTGFSTTFSGGIDQHGVLYNFVDATSISAQGFGFWGTVLAPLADIHFSNGSWDGGIYAKSLTGNAEGHINPLHDRNTCDVDR